MDKHEINEYHTFDTVVGKLCPLPSMADSKAGFFFFPNRALKNITDDNHHQIIAETSKRTQLSK